MKPEIDYNSLQFSSNGIPTMENTGRRDTHSVFAKKRGHGSDLHAERAMRVIARDHGRSERLRDFCGQCSRYGEPFPPYEDMLRAVLKEI